MGTSVGIGTSLQRDAAEAGREAAGNALRQAGVARADFVLVFATVGYHQQTLIDAVREATSRAPLSGCSAEGIITRDLVAETNFAVSVMVLASDELTFQHTRVKEIRTAEGMGGAPLARSIAPMVTAETFGAIILADGLVFHFDPFLESFERALGPHGGLPLFGGLAADNWSSRKTYQYHDGEVFTEGISCVLMSGKGGVAWGINHGCVPVGTRRTVTRSAGNVIYEIDGIPVLEVLKEYYEEEWITEWNKMTLNLCLGFKTPRHIRDRYEEFVVRYLVGKNDEHGYVTVQSDVAEGTELWMLRRDRELIISGISSVAEEVRGGLQGRTPKFVLHFECMGRGKVVFREREKLDLVHSLQREVGGDVPWMGLYTYGEIGPVSRYNSVHNFTTVVTAVY